MSSHTSTALALPKTPSRPRGARRVAALLDAAADIFTEKGVEAATMTAIAQRAGAPIGSLYQFFPAKALLVQALLERYGAQLAESLDELAHMARGLSAEDLARRLVALMLAHAPARDLAIILLESAEAPLAIRLTLRARTLAGVQAVLLAARPGWAGPLAAPRAVAVLHLMKAVPAVAKLRDEGGPDGLGELRAMLAGYLAA